METKIEKTEIKEEKALTIKKKKMKITDIILIILIVLLTISFVFALILLNWYRQKNNINIKLK